MRAKIKINELRARQSTVLAPQNESKFRTSAEDVPLILKNGEGRQLLKSVLGEEASEQEIDLTTVLPSSSKFHRQTKKMGHDDSAYQHKLSVGLRSSYDNAEEARTERTVLIFSARNNLWIDNGESPVNIVSTVVHPTKRNQITTFL